MLPCESVSTFFVPSIPFKYFSKVSSIPDFPITLFVVYPSSLYFLYSSELILLTYPTVCDKSVDTG